MKLKILSLLLIAGLMFNVGCTSSNDEATDTEAADTQLEGETAASPDAAVENADGSTEEVAEGADDFASDEEVVADTGEDQAPDATAEESAKPTDEVAASDELPADSLEDGSKIVAEDGTGTESSDLADGSTEAPAEEGVFDNATSAPSEAASSYVSEDVPKSIPVKKIADAPYQKNGMLLNTVYLARTGEDLNTISQKVGVPKDQLLQANPNLSRSVKVGDKVYYNSPKRPQDSQKMLTYYEDSGLPSQSYVAKSGDNIRKISKNLLGDSSSWKEVWATNLAVDSKDELAEGTELRYWPEGSVAVAEPAPAPEVAPAPEAPQMPEPAAPPVAANEQAPPPPAGDDFALPDDMANANAGAVAGTVANEPPPPPPPPTAAPQKSVASNDEKDLTFMLSAGGLLLVGVGVLLGIIRKGRARKMSMNTHTQI